MPAALGLLAIWPSACWIASCTGAAWLSPRYPISAAKSDGPIKTPSTPSTARISSSASMPACVSTCTKADLRIGRGCIIRNSRKMRGAGKGGARSANALWRVARGTDKIARLLRAFHHWDQKGLRPDVQSLFDRPSLAHGQAHDRQAVLAGQDLQLVHHAAQIVGRMFTINDQPIKTSGGQYFRGIGIGKPGPTPIKRLSLRQGGFEQIFWCGHVRPPGLRLYTTGLCVTRHRVETSVSRGSLTCEALLSAQKPRHISNG